MEVSQCGLNRLFGYREEVEIFHLTSHFEEEMPFKNKRNIKIQLKCAKTYQQLDRVVK